ncbi:MAG: hypothetical protein J7494_02980 [Sphingobium sp.]|nr:hypothetical protein [Sphingobium sp.]
MKFPRISSAMLNLIAFLAVLLTIAILALAGRNDAAILTGLVGVLGSFRPWHTQRGASKREEES